MQVGGSKPPDDPAPSGSAGDGRGAVAGWANALLAGHLVLVSLKSAARQSPLSPDQALALVDVHPLPSSPAGAAPEPTERDIALIRHWLESDAAPDPSALARLAGSIGIRQPDDWAPLLANLLTTSRLTPAQTARAIAAVIGETATGSGAAWSGLLGRLEGAGLPAGEVAALRWQVGCGDMGLTRAERTQLRTLTVGKNAGAAGIGRSGDEAQAAWASLLRKIGGPGRPHRDPAARIVVGAAWLGIVPPGFDGQTIVAARLAVQARAAGLSLPMPQAAFLASLLAMRSVEGRELAFGSPEDRLAAGLWASLGMPGEWSDSRRLGALVARARELGLDDSRAPPEVDEAGAGSITANAPSGDDHPALRGPWPTVLIAGQPMDPAAIEAAPSLRDADLTTYRLWQVERVAAINCPDPGWKGAHVNKARQVLAEHLGNPDAAGFLAITARAVAEGKLSPGELFQAQRWAAADRLGLRKGDVETLQPLATGYTPAQIATAMDMRRGNMGDRLRFMGEQLGVSGSAIDPAVRQALLDAAFREGLLEARVTLPAEPPAEVTPVRPGAAARERPSPDATLAAGPPTPADIAAAPCIPPELLQTFKDWKVANLPEREWQTGSTASRILRARLVQALGDPDARGVVAIATRAVRDGQLLPAELRQAERWAAAETLAFSRSDVALLDALSDGATVREAVAALSVNFDRASNALRRMTTALGLPSVSSGPDALANLMSEALRLGLCMEQPTLLERRAPGPSASRAEDPEIGVDHGGAGVLARAGERGLLMNLAQAAFLDGLARQRPVETLVAEYGPAFESDIRTLNTMLEVQGAWRGGRSVQALVDAAAREGLIEPAPWPSREIAPHQYARLLEERFGIGARQSITLQALADQPERSAGPAKLSAVAAQTGTTAASVRASTINLAVRLCPTVPAAAMARVVGAIQEWVRANHIGAESEPAEIAGAAGFMPSANEMRLLRTIGRSPTPETLRSGGGRSDTAVFRTLLRLEQKLDLPTSNDEARLLVSDVLAAARGRGIV